MNDYRKGSMGEAEQKSLGIAKVVMGIVTTLLLLMTAVGFPKTNLHMWRQKADAGWQMTGIGLFILCYLVLILEESISTRTKNETLWYVLWIICFLGGIVSSCGFNFSL